MKPFSVDVGSSCCQLPIITTEDDEEVRRLDAEAAAAAALSLELVGIFTGEHVVALKAFLSS